MSPMFWLDIIALGISIIIYTALALIAQSAGPRRTLNICFTLFTLMVTIWAVTSLLLRLSLWLKMGNPIFLSELTTLSFAFIGPLLFSFTTCYVKRRTRFTYLATGLGIILIAGLTIPLFQHQIVSNPQLMPNGSTTIDLSTWGIVVAMIPALFIIWAAALFWQERRRLSEPYVIMSVFIFMFGFFVGGILEIPFPLLSITNTLSVIILGYGVISRQLFNPLKEKTAKLQQEIAERSEVEAALRESEERYRSLFRNNHLVMLLLDPDNADIVDANPAACSFYGYSHETLTRKKITAINTLSEAETLEEMERARLEQRHYFLFRHCLANGDIRNVEVYSGPIKIHGRQLLYSIVHDITQRKKTEAALQAEYTFRTSIIEGAAEGLCVCHDITEYPYIEFTVWNDRMTEITGYTIADINRLGWYQAVYPDPETQKRAKERMDRMRHGDNLHAETWEITRADGEKRVINITTSVLQAADNQKHVLALMDDVTEQKRAEEALRVSEDRFRSLVNSMDDTVYMLDTEQRHVGIFGGWLEKQGLSEVMFLGKTAREILGPENATVHENANQRALAGETVTYEWSMAGDSDTVYYQTVVSPLRGSDGQVKGIVGVGRDVTQQKRDEVQLRKLWRAIEQSPGSVTITDTQGNIEYINPKFTELTGYTSNEVLGKSSNILNSGQQSPEFYRALWDTIQAGKVWQGEFHNQRKNGELYWELASISPVRDAQDNITHYVKVAEDITERKRATETMLQTLRLETAATLAGGIAHKVNNLMTVVLGYAELLKNQLDQQPDAQHILNTISNSARQTGELAQQMLAFARGGKYHPRLINLNDLLQSVLQLHRRSIPSTVTMQQNTTPDLWPVKADPAQISQVILNLLTNAAESIETQGQITITTKNIVIDRPQSDLQPGSYVQLTVEDTGSGMDEETQARIFEPFFTTKFQGRGMSLAAVYGIVNNHDGRIIVTSRPDQGSTFTVYLPATEITAEIQPVVKPEQEIAAVYENQKEKTILIVEDEEMILEVVQGMLTVLGYNTLTARNGRKAVDIAQTYSGEIHLALLDLGMPVMSGSEAYPWLQELRPSMQIIIYSGYELDETAQKLLDAGASAFIQKPFQMDELKTEIQKALNN